ncbi:MAG: M20 aminoacylase family protein [Hyphomicrobiaceae bacterium]|nr:M20 aminoacylase family protein [Hyphomicrobiaceae bacterium]
MPNANETLETIRTFHAELTAIRQDIHAHPELGMEEHRTADLVAAKLAEWGIEVHRGVGKTGVVGVLRRGNGPKSIGLRADMDALPIEEATGVAYASKFPGKMHACGHDGHTTMLLGAARYLAQSDTFNGTVNFIFQPGEEGCGGAEAMLKDGLFERFPCDVIYGMHNRPGEPVGKFVIAPGTAMAAASFFDIAITGRGAHGARPEGSIDPVLVASQIVSAIQSIVARNVPPADTAVVSVTMIHAGDAYNVIPQTARLGGTVRTMKSETMALVESSMRRIATSVAAGFGATAELDFRYLFAPLVNEAKATQEVADAAAEMVGDDKVNRTAPPVAASEDFSFMLEKVRGAYINLGNGVDSIPVHNPAYNFNDEAIPYGAALYARLVERELQRMPGQA